MCGFVTVLAHAGDAGDRLPGVQRATRDLRHRGPDDAGLWHDHDVALGFRRLSIIDVAGSHQPLSWGPPDEPDRYVITFNGEIYNYPELRAELADAHGAVFATHGDTEVLVAAFHHWGPAMVTRLRGMFAFCLWDRRERALFGARDPFGIKPLYVVADAEATAFASEKKSLLALAPDRKLDAAAVQDYLALQYVPEPASMHRAVRRIESGTRFSVRPGEPLRAERYFHPVLRESGPTGERAHARIAAALADSVRVHMRADVPVGAFLSGGIDSTAIAALAHRHNPGLLTFTAGFERSGYSEVDIAAETAAALGVRHVVRTVTAQEVMDELPSIVWHLDDPVADPALVPLWFVAREAARHVKVVLSGEGADELFGGYTIYREPLSLAPFERVPGTLRRLLGRASARLPDGVRGKDLLRRGALPLEQRYHGNARIFRPDQLPDVLRRHDPVRTESDVTADHYAASVGWDPVARMQHVDLFTWLRGDILVKADRMTMAHSLELRVPFLDPEVFAAASDVPRSEKLADGTTKYALRRAVADLVPPHVLHRPKLGFPVPVRHWLREEMHEWAVAIVRDSGADDVLDLAAVLRMIETHRHGRVDHSRRIWAVLVLLIWHGIVVEGRIRPPHATATGRR
ncbi:MAG: asparagine synthase (glutamine-hydrolyzing) [Pseudonocardiales bacterium]|nr:asparagine synthase (glutamine-hydrolyzing) [Pseudonocardiales bacterium]